MTVLEMRLNGSNVQPSANPTNQASHAAAPEAHNMAVEGVHILFVIGFIMLLIYGLKILGRVIKRVE